MAGPEHLTPIRAAAVRPIQGSASINLADRKPGGSRACRKAGIYEEGEYRIARTRSSNRAPVRAPIGRFDDAVRFMDSADQVAFIVGIGIDTVDPGATSTSVGCPGYAAIN